jgi:hypothetical protein
MKLEWTMKESRCGDTTIQEYLVKPSSLLNTQKYGLTIELHRRQTNKEQIREFREHLSKPTGFVREPTEEELQYLIPVYKTQVLGTLIKYKTEVQYTYRDDNLEAVQKEIEFLLERLESQ